MHKKGIWLAAALLILVVAASSVFAWKSQDKTAIKPSGNPAAPKVETPADPLTIEAMRSRQYPGSDIVVEQTLSNRGTYQDALISYKSDGLKIQALQSIPNTPKPAAGWPVVILDHGYIPPTQYQTYSEDYREFIAAFTVAGFMVIKPDYGGTDKARGARKAAISRQLTLTIT